MPQTKIYGNADFIQQNRDTLSTTIHSCIVDAWNYPIEKYLIIKVLAEGSFGTTYLVSDRETSKHQEYQEINFLAQS